MKREVAELWDEPVIVETVRVQRYHWDDIEVVFPNSDKRKLADLPATPFTMKLQSGVSITVEKRRHPK